MKYFYSEEAPTSKRYYIRPIHDNLKLKYTTGSFNIICARILGISYVEYLRMCRDMYGGQIIGKDKKYPVVNFEKGEKLTALVKLLNENAEKLSLKLKESDI